MLNKSYIKGIIEAGCDEAGRGPLVGSVFAAAVVMDDNVVTDKEQQVWINMLNDSKRLNVRDRNYLKEKIEQYALTWAVAEVTAEEIDQINILNASIKAMQKALDKLNIRPEHIIVDGNRWKPYIPAGGVMEIPAQTVVKGDGKYLSIAAASILAKTYRDEYMMRLHNEYPQYHWNTNMGYPTKTHYEAIKQYGITPYHRKSFKLIKIK